MASKAKTPNPIDVHVGSRVRLRRTMAKLSQEKLGDALGVTFQQIQKYEKGTNRIGASRMQKISETLNVPISFFFEDAPGSKSNSDSPGMEEAGSANFVMDFLSSAEGIELNRAFVRIPNAAIRRRIIDMVRTIAEETGEPEQ
ncbi:MAG: helix-turn-helix domain-containing protein [Rhizobiaceae bacterium]|nr:helix-turn-helix domain-containing protein [Rhizobiaceae bacterium]